MSIWSKLQSACQATWRPNLRLSGGYLTGKRSFLNKTHAEIQGRSAPRHNTIPRKRWVHIIFTEASGPDRRRRPKTYITVCLNLPSNREHQNQSEGAALLSKGDLDFIDFFSDEILFFIHSPLQIRGQQNQSEGAALLSKGDLDFIDFFSDEI